MNSRLLKDRLKWGTVIAVGLALSLAPSLYQIDENISSRATIEKLNIEEAVMGFEEKGTLIRSLDFLYSSTPGEYFCRHIKENHLQTLYLSRKSFYVFTGHLYLPHQIIRWLSDLGGTSRNPWISV